MNTLIWRENKEKFEDFLVFVLEDFCVSCDITCIQINMFSYIYLRESFRTRIDVMQKSNDNLISFH